MVSSISQDFHVHTTYSDGSGNIQSMVLACASRGIKNLAITDHVDEHGRFLFLPSFREPPPLREYLDEIDATRGIAAERGIRLHAGVELMACHGEHPVTGDLAAALHALSVVHLDGVQVHRVAARAVDLVSFASRTANPPPVICISHPDYLSFTLREIELMLGNGIVFELNNAKFSPRDADGIHRLLDIATEHGWAPPSFLIGSDAHSSMTAGDVAIVAEFARRAGLHVLSLEKD